MPDEYIKRDAVLDYLTIMPIDIGFSDIDRVIDFVKELPAADVAPVKHGKWVRARGMMPPEAFGVYECSVCGWMQDYHIPTRMREKTPFCPGCGARLEGGNDES